MAFRESPASPARDPQLPRRRWWASEEAEATRGADLAWVSLGPDGPAVQACPLLSVPLTQQNRAMRRGQGARPLWRGRRRGLGLSHLEGRGAAPVVGVGILRVGTPCLPCALLVLLLVPISPRGHCLLVSLFPCRSLFAEP